MAQVVFSGSSDGLNLTSARTISLSGSSSGVGIVNYVDAYARFSTTNASQLSGKTIYVSVYSGNNWHNGSYYISGSGDWNGEYSGHTFKVPISVGSGFDLNDVSSMQVSVSGGGGYIFTKGSFSVLVDYTVPSANGAPSRVSPSVSTANPGAGLTISYPGAYAGTANSIAGYEIEYQDRANSGAQWPSSWSSVVQNTSSTSRSVTAASGYGAQRRWRVRTRSNLGESYFSGWVYSSAVTTNSPTANGAPTSANPDATALNPGASTTLRFPGASGGALGGIAGYRIEMAERASSSASWPSYWEEVVASTPNATFSVNASSNYGAQRKFRVKALSSLSSEYDSGWRESTSFITTNSPTANTPPTSVSVSATALDPGKTTTLSYTGATAGKLGSIPGYKIEFQDRSSSSVAWPTYWQELEASRPQTTLTVYAPDQYGAQRRFRVKALSSIGETYDSGWVISSNSITSNSPIAATAPTALAVNPTVAEEGATLSWSGAKGARFNSIEGIEIEYAESTNNGVSYANWSSITTVNTTQESGSLYVSVGSARGSLRKFRARVRGSAGSEYYSAWKESTNTLRKSSIPTAPTAVSFDEQVFENSVVMNWDGATDGYGNTITKYRIAYQTSNDGTYFGDEIVIDTANANKTYTLNTASFDRGKKLRFKVAAIGSGGLVSEYSQYSQVAAKNSIPLPASNVVVPSVVDPSELEMNISFTPATDVDNNIAGYEIALKYPDGTWYDNTRIVGTTTGGAASPVKLNVSSYGRGVSWRIAIRPYDSLGIRGEWAESVGLVKINELQAVPIVVFPKQNTKTYNQRPRVGIQIGQGAQGKKFELKLSIDGEQHASTGQYMNEFSARGSDIDSGRQTVWMKASATGIKNVVLSGVLTNDGVADLPVVNRPADVLFSVVNTNFTDPVLVRNVTSVKAIHITQIREAINNVEAYYGITKTDWSDTLIPRVTAIKASHVIELRTAIDAIKAYVNSFDVANSINDIPRYSWTDPYLTNQTIKVEHIQEIRDSILTL